MSVDHVGRTCFGEKLADALAVVRAERLDADAGQDPREISLPAPVPPDLADHRGTYPDRCSLTLEHPQLGTDQPVPAIDCYEGASVQDSFQATSRRGASPSRDAASSSSASVNGPSSASH